jgi:hypothetical protein
LAAGRDDLAAGRDDLAAGRDDLAAGRDGVAVAPRRSPPRRDGRVGERFPSTPVSAFAAFFVFFFPDFSAIT